MDASLERKTSGALLYRIYAALLFTHYTLAFLTTTTLYAVTNHTLFYLLYYFVVLAMLIVSTVVTVKELLEQLNSGGERWRVIALAAFRCALVVLTIVSFLINRWVWEAWFLSLLAITCMRFDEKRLFRTGYKIGAFLVVAFFFLSMLDIVHNNRGDAFGFIYRTHYACHLLCLALAYCVWKDGKLSWRAELGLVALFILNALFIKGKTLFACLLLLMIGTYWRHYRHIGGIPCQDRQAFGPVVPILFKIVYLPVWALDCLVRWLRLDRFDRKRLYRVMVWSFVICAIVIISLSVFYRPLKPLLDRVPGLETVKSRLLMGAMAFEEFPVRILGNYVPQMGMSSTEDIVPFYYALDSGYIKLLLEYGWLLFLVVLGLMTWAQVRLFRSRRYYAVFLLSIFAIDGMMEYWIVSLAYNLFILLASCKLECPEVWEACPDIQGDRPRGGKAILRNVGLALGAVALCWWCATAYPISTWSNWTPVSNATVVVPGSYIDGISTQQMRERRLEQALQYMEAYEGSRCILAGGQAEAGEMMDWMLAHGVDAKRLTADARSASVDEMLVNAKETIESDGLPARMTVCTFKMQQARVARRASAMNLPVNGLTVDMPWLVYLPNYFLEQWKILL